MFSNLFQSTPSPPVATAAARGRRRSPPIIANVPPVTAIPVPAPAPAPAPQPPPVIVTVTATPVPAPLQPPIPTPPPIPRRYVAAQSFDVTGPSSKITLQLESQNLHGDAPPNQQRSYDFIIPIETITSIQEGWPVIFSCGASEYLGHHDYKFTHLQTVGILGYYSKGKSFLVNNLYKRVTNIPSSTSSNGSFIAPEGPSVTTQGLSGVFMSDERTINNSNLLIIDTAGRNSPALRISTGTTDTKELENQINEIRAKERLIDEVITDIADTIIYVVDEVLNEDQRTLLHLVRKLTSTQNVILVHNFKRINATDGQEHIQDQIVKPFGAIPYHTNGCNVWSSKYPIDSNRHAFMIHVPLFNQETSLDYNNIMFNFIYANISHPPSQVIHQNPIQRICQSIAERLPLVVKVIDNETVDNERENEEEEIKVDDGNETKDNHENTNENIRITRIRDENTSMIIKLRNQKAELLSWDLLPLPTRESNSAWKPRFFTSLNRKDLTFFARIDLPGLDLNHQLQTPPTDETNENWWCIEIDKISNFEVQNFTISGFRKKIYPDDENSDFGEFRVELGIPQYFDLVKYELICSTLIIDGKKSRV